MKFQVDVHKSELAEQVAGMVVELEQDWRAGQGEVMEEMKRS